MKKLLVFFLMGLALVFGWANHAVGQVPTPNQAQVLTQQGFQYLDRGDAATALDRWQAAESEYRKLRLDEGIVGSQVNQSLALQQLGLYPRACKTLVQALALNAQLCQAGAEVDEISPERMRAIAPTNAHRSGLNSLGIVLTALGKPEAAVQVLTAILPQVEPALRPALALSIGNAHSVQVLQYRGQYEATDDPTSRAKVLDWVQKSTNSALVAYNQALTGDERTTVQAQVNALQLLTDLTTWRQEDRFTQPLRDRSRTELESRLSQAQDLQFASLSPIESIYAQLSLTQSLQRLGQLRPAQRYARQALGRAESLGNLRAQSFAWGTLARQATGAESTSLYQKALSLARSSQAWDVAYRWERSLGQLAQQQGQQQQAAEYYRAAVQDLDLVRGNLLAIDSRAQFSLEDQVEPIYREYLQVLFSNSTPDLVQAIAVSQKLQRVQLENYLRCGQLDWVALNQVQPPTQNTTKFYVIESGQQLEVIVQSSNQQLHHYSVRRALVQTEIQVLQSILQNDNFETTTPDEFLPPAQRLYQLLIAPAQRYLPAAGTLVFAVDYGLQSIPMGMLHNGQEYLIQRYSIANTLGTQLRQPASLSRLEALIAGVSQVAPSFDVKIAPPGLQALPEVEQEVREIAAATSAKVLLNQAFTVSALQAQMRQRYPIVHLTTHGQFSSDPASTFLLAWDKPITVQQLNQLVKERREQQDSIELLVLSACQTAKGDRQSALGLAGVATQAGARSTVASLWLVDAGSTATLMTQFYNELKQGQSKAEALRQAELALLSQPETRHPYYWAAFLLTGSWL
jgi:CHAT domain-containing protein